MTMTVPQRQVYLLKLAKEALRSLSAAASKNGDLLARRELFKEKQGHGPIEKAQVTALKKLERAGAITSIKQEGGRQPILYGINKPELVSKLLEGDEALSNALWPAPEMPAVEPEPELPLDEPEGLPAEAPSAEGPPSVEAMMLAVLKAVAKMGEGIAAMNEHLATIAQRQEEIATKVSASAPAAPVAALPSFDPEAIVEALLSALTLPKLGEAEAKQLKEGDELLYYNGPLPEPVKVINVRVTPGQPVTVTVARPGGSFTPVTPKFLSKRRAA